MTAPTKRSTDRNWRTAQLWDIDAVAGRGPPAARGVRAHPTAAVERQPTLFEVGVSEPTQDIRLQTETSRPTLSAMPDKRTMGRLRRLCLQLEEAATPLERARVAAEVRDMAERIVAEAVRGANRGGQTWREIGAELGVPFQTLYRRYGGDERK